MFLRELFLINSFPLGHGKRQYIGVENCPNATGSMKQAYIIRMRWVYIILMDVYKLCEHFWSLFAFRWQELYNNHYLPFCKRFEVENIEGLPMTSSSFFAARKEHRPYYKKHRKVH